MEIYGFGGRVSLASFRPPTRKRQRQHDTIHLTATAEFLLYFPAISRRRRRHRRRRRRHGRGNERKYK